jgi:hypothetical protein
MFASLALASKGCGGAYALGYIFSLFMVKKFRSAVCNIADMCGALDLAFSF